MFQKCSETLGWEAFQILSFSSEKQKTPMEDLDKNAYTWKHNRDDQWTSEKTPYSNRHSQEEREPHLKQFQQIDKESHANSHSPKSAKRQHY